MRERLDLVEQILRNNSHQLDTLVSSPVKKQVIESNSKYGKFMDDPEQRQPLSMVQDIDGVMSVDNVYTELI